jgi:hypothetical protein
VPTPHADEATRLVQGMVGQYLPQLCVGAGDLQLRLSEGITITFESPVRFPDGTVAEPFGLDALARFLPLLNADVTGVRVHDDAGLTVTFGDTEVRCPADPDFEAWNVSGGAGLLVVCTPGGGLAIWPPA